MGESSSKMAGVLRSSGFEERMAPHLRSSDPDDRISFHLRSSRLEELRTPFLLLPTPLPANSGHVFWASEGRSSDRSSSAKIGSKIEIGPLLDHCSVVRDKQIQ